MECFQNGEHPERTIAWSPDSKWLAFPHMEAEANNFSLFLISVETGEKQRLTNPPSTATGDTAPAFSPDGHTLAFSRDSWIQSELYLLPLGEGYRPQGEPKRVDTGNLHNLGAAWTPDGSEIVFSAGNAVTQGLWRMEVAKPGKLVRASFTSDKVEMPSLSKTGKRLAGIVKLRRSLADWANEQQRTSLSRIPISGRDHKPCRLALLQILPKLQRCGRSSGGARHHSQLRNHPTVVSKVW
jgi:Tol biopolymer transport system component